MRKGKFSHEVAIALTADELNARARLAAREHQRVKELEEQKKEQVKEITQEIKEAKKEHDRITDVVQKGVELRLVDCVERLNITDKCVEIVRCDNEEIVTTRPLTADENQLRIDETFKGFERTAKEHAEEERKAKEETAVVTTGATVISEMAKDKPLALAASNPTHADNDNAGKKKKKSGAERAREKKAGIAKNVAKDARKTGAKASSKNGVVTVTADKPKRAAKPVKAASKAPKSDKPKRPKKQKSVLEREVFDDEAVA